MENITGGIVDSGSIAALLICLPMAYLAGAILSSIVQEGWKDRKVFEGSTSEGLRSAEGIVEEIAAHDSGTGGWRFESSLGSICFLSTYAERF